LEIRQKWRRRGIEDAAAISGDEVVGHLPIGCETPQRFLFVLGNQPAVAGNIGRKIAAILRFIRPAPDNDLAQLEHDPEKHGLGLDPRVGTGFPKRSCSNKR